MTASTWHLDDVLAQRYADGGLSPATAASVEQHLMACPDCRGLVGGRAVAAEPDRFAGIWSEIVEEVHAPRRGPVERALRALGVSDSTSRILATTPTLRGAWLSAIVLVLLLALYVAHASPRGAFLFVSLAPVLPLLGVIATFGPPGDPSSEMAAAAPYSRLRLLTARTAFVLASTLLPALAVSRFLPGDRWFAVAWLLPGLALTTATLAAAHWVPVHRAAIGLLTLWLALGAGRWVGEGPGRRVTTAATTVDHVVQVASVVVIALAALTIARHRHQLPRDLRRNE
jgi:predicted anti-sigma-YlaC factor YlaD